MSLEALVPQIEQWLKNKGAEFVVHQPSGMLWPTEWESTYEYTPPERPAEGRWLYVTEQVNEWLIVNGRMMVSPVLWERALELLLEDAERILVRSVSYVKPDEFASDIQMPFIRVRLNVIRKEPPVKPLAIQFVELFYPRTDVDDRAEDQPQAIHISLSDVRAADSILVEYDFDRDGWKISMATVHWFPVDGPMDPEYAEVAFVPAWATAGKGDCDCQACEEAREENDPPERKIHPAPCEGTISRTEVRRIIAEVRREHRENPPDEEGDSQ